jgi:chromosome segregation ATPase
MGSMDELDKIKKAIDDAQIRFKSIESAIEQIDKEIAILAPRKLELETNIEFHKKENTIPIVNEHRKTKAELSKTTARLILIMADRKRAAQACNDVRDIIEKMRKDHEELLRNSENNVLRGRFGAKRGKN